MGANTKIEWADHSWSPWRGCTKISPGCAHCYAEALSHRNPAVLGNWGKGAPRVLAKSWHKPVRWDSIGPVCGCGGSVVGECGCGRTAGRNQRVFPSLCDWLDEEVPAEWLARFFQLIHDTPNLDWLLLTKRPENFQAVLERALEPASWPGRSRFIANWLTGTPPRNVWCGVSVEDQIRAEQRIPVLLSFPAKLRWLSVEPLLGPVDLNLATFNGADSLHSLPGIDWLVIGGESGPGARPCNVEWVRTVVRSGETAGVPVFVKQLGTRPELRTGFHLKLDHPKGGDPSEWAEDLRIRQFPTPVAP